MARIYNVETLVESVSSPDQGKASTRVCTGPTPDGKKIAVQMTHFKQLISGGQVSSQVWWQVRWQVQGQVNSQVWEQVWDQVSSQVSSQVWEQFK